MRGQMQCVAASASLFAVKIDTPTRREPPQPVFQLAQTDLKRTAALVDALNIPHAAACVLVNRGHDTPEAARTFLSPRLDSLSEPMQMAGMAEAVDLLARAVIEARPVVVYGDYDVDGVTSTSLLISSLESFGHGVADWHLPDRQREGYGLNTASARALASRTLPHEDGKPGLFIAVDCGINSVKEVAAVKELGLNVIVVDHHQLGGHLPNADAVLNPWRPDCDFPTRDLCAAGITFLLIAATRRALRDRGWFTSREEPSLRKALDLAALGTIADMVPLAGDNRILAFHGLREMARAERPGMLALMQVAGVRPESLRAGQVGFQLAPRINAAGRMGDARRAVSLLTSHDLAHAIHLAGELDRDNQKRQAVEEQTMREAAAQLEARIEELERDGTPCRGTVLFGDAWHPGVIGIVASRLVERYAMPLFLVAMAGPHGRGSGRTFGAFNLHEALTSCAPALTQFGGHAAAAGLSIAREHRDAFRRLFEATCRDRLTDADLIPRLKIDAELYSDEIDADLVEALTLFEPYGIGNAEPSFLLKHHGVEKTGVVGQGKHLRLRVRGARRNLDAIAFNHGHLARGGFDESRVVVMPEYNTYLGGGRIQLRVKRLFGYAAPGGSRDDSALDASDPQEVALAAP